MKSTWQMAMPRRARQLRDRPPAIASAGIQFAGILAGNCSGAKSRSISPTTSSTMVHRYLALLPRARRVSHACAILPLFATYFSVEYSDGDEEDLNEAELAPLLAHAKTLRPELLEKARQARLAAQIKRQVYDSSDLWGARGSGRGSRQARADRSRGAAADAQLSLPVVAEADFQHGVRFISCFTKRRAVHQVRKLRQAALRRAARCASFDIASFCSM